MDPTTITTIMVGVPALSGTLAAADIARDFVKRVLAPSADELGKGLVPQWLKTWKEARVQRGFETITDAALQLHAAGKEATAVPGRVLFPILQSASLEEAPDLRRMWAMMLANAADSARATDMMPAFAAILAELTPVEAVILEAVYLEKQDGEPRVGYNPDKPPNMLDWRLEYVGSDRTSLKKVTLPENDYRVMADNLGRLGLLEEKFWGATLSGGSSSTKIYGALRLSPLGERFVAVCVKLVH